MSAAQKRSEFIVDSRQAEFIYTSMLFLVAVVLVSPSSSSFPCCRRRSTFVTNGQYLLHVCVRFIFLLHHSPFFASFVAFLSFL